LRYVNDISPGFSQMRLFVFGGSGCNVFTIRANRAEKMPLDAINASHRPVGREQAPAVASRYGVASPLPSFQMTAEPLQESDSLASALRLTKY
jgi:hypothetical protein